MYCIVRYIIRKKCVFCFDFLVPHELLSSGFFIISKCKQKGRSHPLVDAAWQYSCTFCEVIAEHFKKRAKCFEKMPNWRQKRQNGGRQLKVCCHYKIIKLLALINALDSYSKSKFDPKWLHLALNVSSKHSVPKKMRYYSY